MVCIGKRPHILYGRSSALHFRYLTCLLDKGHITEKCTLFFCTEQEKFWYNDWNIVKV